jgi:class 3 adenylate cyclase/tetratricopeptide (TPR) repeat protein
VQRKVVTVFFSDLVGSTELGEKLDAERFRRLLGRYFDEVRAVLERHGGAVEKYIGDAVVAIFGVPVAHEDDALRALRAAAAIRERLADLNDDLERDFGVRLGVRTGIHTGEVLVQSSSDPGLTALGDTMNVAARLEQSAAPGEILVGAQTRELGGEAIVVEALDPLPVKGKSEPLVAFRLVEVLPDVAPYRRRDDVPLVGRQQELALLRETLERAQTEQDCFLATIVGVAGVGKSRLAREFLASLGGSVRVLLGRCSSDTAGRTFLPLAEALQPVLGSEPRSRVRELLAGDEHTDLVADQLAAAVGADGGGAATEETFWAIRRVLEALASERPLVLVLDDVHWAEATLLDLVEYVAGFSRGVPLLLMCLSRPDLLEERATWSAPRDNAVLAVLAPLAEEDSLTLLMRLSPERDFASGDVRRILDAADGNPLFLEQLLALNRERDGDLVVPPTIQALLQARLDRLAQDERTVLEHAAVEGRVFTRRLLVELLPPALDTTVGTQLLSLARRQFIRPLQAVEPGEEVFAFVHALVRDAAYGAVPKELRAELHARLAELLEQRGGVAAEVVGHHLAEAVGYRRELGEEDRRTAVLADKGAELLAVGARRALGVGDDRAAARLLRRAAELVPAEDPVGRSVRGELGRALTGTGELEGARATFTEVRDAARACGERALEFRAELGLANFRVQTDPTMSNEQVAAVAKAAIPVFEVEGDEYGLACSWFLIHWTEFREGRYRHSIELAETAIEHAARAGDMREQLRSLGAIAMAHLWGPTPVDDAHARLDELVERSGRARLMEAFAHRVRGGLCSLTGEFERGREHCREAVEIYRELGHRVSAVGVAVELQRVERKAGNLDLADQELRAAHEAAEELGDLGYVSWITASLARVLAEEGKFEEALRLVERHDLNTHFAYTRVISELVRALVASAAGKREEAEAHARRALTLVEQTDILDLHGDVLVALADLDRAAGRDAEARGRETAALDLYERKGDVVSAARVRERG